MTYTPRLIAVDLKGSLSNFTNCTGDLRTASGDLDVLWGGHVECHKTESSAKNTFLKSLEDFDGEKDFGESSKSLTSELEEKVKVWSDFLKAPLHPRSVSLLAEHFHENDTDPFDIFPVGSHCWKREESHEELENLTRIFAEECDYLQVLYSSLVNYLENKS